MDVRQGEIRGQRTLTQAGDGDTRARERLDLATEGGEHLGGHLAGEVVVEGGDPVGESCGRELFGGHRPCRSLLWLLRAFRLKTGPQTRFDQTCRHQTPGELAGRATA